MIHVWHWLPFQRVNVELLASVINLKIAAVFTSKDKDELITHVVMCSEELLLGS